MELYTKDKEKIASGGFYITSKTYDEDFFPAELDALYDKDKRLIYFAPTNEKTKYITFTVGSDDPEKEELILVDEDWWGTDGRLVAMYVDGKQVTTNTIPNDGKVHSAALYFGDVQSSSFSLKWLFYESDARVINMSGFDATKVTSVEKMFFGCKAKKVYAEDLEITCDTKEMFYECGCEYISLKNSAISGDSAESMFANSFKLRYVDWDGFKFSGTESAKNLFKGCSALESIDWHNVIVNEISDFSRGFENCENLESVYLGGDDSSTSPFGDFTNLFKGCTSLRNFNDTEFGLNFNQATFNGCFEGCTSLQTVTFDDYLDPLEDTDWNNAFKDCPNLDIIKFNSLTPIFDLEAADMLSTGLTSLREVRITNLSMLSSTNLFVNYEGDAKIYIGTYDGTKETFCSWKGNLSIPSEQVIGGPSCD